MTDPEEYEAIWPLLDKARTFGRAAFEAAAVLLASADASERAVACDLLGMLCNPDEHHWGPEVATALIDLAESEEDTDVFGPSLGPWAMPGTNGASPHWFASSGIPTATSVSR